MKKFLIALNIVIWSFVGYQTTAYAADKKPAATKKEVKKHKKVEGTKVPDAPAKKDTKKKK